MQRRGEGTGKATSFRIVSSLRRESGGHGRWEPLEILLLARLLPRQAQIFMHSLRSTFGPVPVIQVSLSFCPVGSLWNFFLCMFKKQELLLCGRTGGGSLGISLAQPMTRGGSFMSLINLSDELGILMYSAVFVTRLVNSALACLHLCALWSCLDSIEKTSKRETHFKKAEIKPLFLPDNQEGMWDFDKQPMFNSGVCFPKAKRNVWKSPPSAISRVS